MAVITEDEPFTPFHGVFGHFDREEKEYIHTLVDRYRTLKKQNPKSREAHALRWALVTLRDLETVD